MPFKSHFRGITRKVEHLKSGQATLEQATEMAVRDSLEFVKGNALFLLKQQPHRWPYRTDPETGEAVLYDVATGELAHSFRKRILEVGAGVVRAALTNIDPHALYLEYGTPDHRVDPVNAPALRWYNGAGGAEFSRGHEVSGIRPTHFMEEALRVSRRDIEGIFAYRLQQAGFHLGHGWEGRITSAAGSVPGGRFAGGGIMDTEF